VSLRIRTGVCETTYTPIQKSDWNTCAHKFWIKALKRKVTRDKNSDKPVAEIDFLGVDFAPSEGFQVSQGCLRELKNSVKDCEYVADIERFLFAIEQGWENFRLDLKHGDFKRGVKALWKAFKDSGLAKYEPVVMELLQESGFARSVEGLTQALWMRGKAAKFAEVRDALIHLDKLGLVDYENGEYSARESLM
jgi:hypothetical protein